MKTLKPAPETPEPPRRKRLPPWDRCDSIALIANNGGDGCILAHDGPGIEVNIEALGYSDLDDHGLDGAPDGLSIWEGTLTVYPGSYEYPLETDAVLEGDCRDLTDREWELLRTTGVPWEYEPEETT